MNWQEWLVGTEPFLTPEEWLASTSPETMLQFLIGTNGPRVQDIEAFPASKGLDRKLRLFACACYYPLRHLLPNPQAQAAVWVAERFANGSCTTDKLEQTKALIWAQVESLEMQWRASQGVERTALLPTHEALALALVILWREAPKAAYYASSNACLTFAGITNPGAASGDNRFSASRAAEERVQADLLRCIFDNLFHRVAIAPEVLTWDDCTVAKLAQGIYEDRAFDLLPSLANALQEAGCNNAEILDHLRGGGPHVPGCWVVDLLLRKE
jgi:hypothetical protein